MTHSQIVWDRYSALYNLFMHLKSSKTENLEALLLLLCPALTKIKTCVGLGSNPATDPQVCLTPRVHEVVCLEESQKAIIMCLDC